MLGRPDISPVLLRANKVGVDGDSQVLLRAGAMLRAGGSSAVPARVSMNGIVDGGEPRAKATGEIASCSIAEAEVGQLLRANLGKEDEECTAEDDIDPGSTAEENVADSNRSAIDTAADPGNSAEDSGAGSVSTAEYLSACSLI